MAARRERFSLVVAPLPDGTPASARTAPRHRLARRRAARLSEVFPETAARRRSEKRRLAAVWALLMKPRREKRQARPKSSAEYS